MSGPSLRQPAEVLEELGRRYHHIEHAHEREPASGATRRRRERDMAEVTARFDRMLASWVLDEDLRARWQAYLYEMGPAPDTPRLAIPPVFKGTSETGAVLAIRPALDGAYDVVVDGATIVHEHVPWHLDPDLRGPVLVAGQLYQEIFDAPPAAVRALASFLATPGAGPPCLWARALVEDGLCDLDLALTPRGERCLRAAGSLSTSVARSTFCVLVADGARARILTLETDAAGLVATSNPLTEVADLTSPERRARDSEVLSDTRPGLRREGPHGPRHAVSDRREGHRHDADRRFAEMVVEAAAHLWRQSPRSTVIVAASPGMLGLLRPAIARRRRGASWPDVHQLARDLTKLSAPALHDALADLALLPPRERLAPPAFPRPAAS